MIPLTSRLWIYTKGVVDHDKDQYGVYELLDSNDILYIGQGLVHSRLIAHFPDGSDPIVGATQYRIEYTASKKVAERREKEELDKYYSQNRRYPKFNQRRDMIQQ